MENPIRGSPEKTTQVVSAVTARCAGRAQLSGIMIGESDTVPGSFDTDAFLYHRGTMTNISGLPGCMRNYAYGVNRAGDAVGYSWCGGTGPLVLFNARDRRSVGSSPLACHAGGRGFEPRRPRETK